MAMLSIKLKNKESAEKIVETIMSQYRGEIVSYDIETLSREVHPEEGAIYAYRQISRKGGSVYVTIPSPIVRFMNLKKGDVLLFVVREKLGRTYIEKVGYQLVRE